MSSPNILLTRIDNRLVHGQVGVTWTSTIGANLLVVVDDVVANDDIPIIIIDFNVLLFTLHLYFYIKHINVTLYKYLTTFIKYRSNCCIHIIILIYTVL